MLQRFDQPYGTVGIGNEADTKVGGGTSDEISRGNLIFMSRAFTNVDHQLNLALLDYSLVLECAQTVKEERHPSLA